MEMTATTIKALLFSALRGRQRRASVSVFFFFSFASFLALRPKFFEGVEAIFAGCRQDKVANVHVRTWYEISLQTVVPPAATRTAVL